MSSSTKMSAGETPYKSAGSGKESGRDSEGPFSEDPPPTILVWIARTLTLAALLSIIGYLFWLISTDSRPAQFVVDARWSELDPRGGEWVLPITVTNDSTEAVTNVVLDAAFQPPGREEVNLSTTLPLMGEGERALLEMVFEDEPTPDTLDLRVSSYQSP
ncbi:MAG: hypothetical protein AAF311_03800 [Pseudomonadota bacterium]